ncbi:MAG TPA: putative Ig domain-containing protein, partial [Mycobacterium sp.]
TNTFTDPQGQPLTYAATLSSGAALPPWLTFNAATATFSGTAPATAQSLTVKVTATDSIGLTVSESVTADVRAAAVAQPGIIVSAQTPNPIWTGGTTLDVVLPSNTFTDALGLKMTFAAYQVSGPSVTSWLRFNAATDTLSGLVPTTASGTIGIAVVATDALHLTAVDMFGVTFASGSVHAAALTPGAMSGSMLSFDPAHSAQLLPLHL